MARLVALFIEDNDEAQTFVDELANQETRGIPFPPKGTVPLALFAVPTQYCECPNRFDTGPTNDYRVTRGANLGWWIHRDCGKPKEKSWQSPKNLLTPAGEHSRVYVNWTYQPPLIGQLGIKENSSGLGGQHA